MTLRPKQLLWFFVAFAAGGVLALPGVHWRLIGWYRGEVFAQGRPASQWRGLVSDAHAAYAAVDRLGPDGMSTTQVIVVLMRRSDTLD